MPLANPDVYERKLYKLVDRKLEFTGPHEIRDADGFIVKIDPHEPAFWRSFPKFVNVSTLSDMAKDLFYRDLVKKMKDYEMAMSSYSTQRTARDKEIELISSFDMNSIAMQPTRHKLAIIDALENMEHFIFGNTDRIRSVNDDVTFKIAMQNGLFQLDKLVRDVRSKPLDRRPKFDYRSKTTTIDAWVDDVPTYFTGANTSRTRQNYMKRNWAIIESITTNMHDPARLLPTWEEGAPVPASKPKTTRKK